MTRDDITRMARECGAGLTDNGNLIADRILIERFAALVAAAEREECAKLCDGIAGAAQMNTTVLPESRHRMVAADDCAAVIRARSK